MEGGKDEEDCVTSTRLSGDAGHPMDATVAFLGFTPQGYCLHPMGRDPIPTLQALQYAVWPSILETCSDKDVPSG